MQFSRLYACFFLIFISFFYQSVELRDENACIFNAYNYTAPDGGTSECRRQ